jgi:hypothetical protein
MKREPLPQRRRLVYWGITGVVALVFCGLLAEGISQVVLRVRYRWRAPAAQERTLEYDSLLGWKPVPGRHFAKTQPQTFSNQGFRALHDYTAEVPPGRYRIVFLGDSFTQGAVGDDDTYPAQLEALAPTIESVNMGRNAYGLDQMYLWYKRDGALLHADLLLVAFIEEDFVRMASDTFRTLFPKPQLALHGRMLVPVNVPVPTWGGAAATTWIEEFPRGTALFKVLHKARQQLFGHYEMFPVVARIFDDWKEVSGERHQSLVLVYLPTAMDRLGSAGPPRPIAERVENIAKDAQIPFWNLTSMFQGLSPSEIAPFFLDDGHYSARGNRLVASTLLERLTSEILPPRAAERATR